jgi:ssDNA-binding Zn-finger/Zn-ribbon topoisomerase 1/very-short-patch-repair endonuclease
MPLEQGSVRSALQSFVSRLIQSVGRSPLLKGFPTKAVTRIDLERLRVASKDAPEQLVSSLLGPLGSARLSFEDFANPGRRGDESRALFSALKTKLHRQADLVFRETGLRTLWLAYPMLYVPDPSDDAEDFVLAPLFLWPLRISAAGMAEGELVIARDPEGGGPRFNRAAMFRILRSLDFAPEEPILAEVRDSESLADIEGICKRFGASFRPPLEVNLQTAIVAIPSRDELRQRVAAEVLNCGLVGLIQWENQELIRDLEALQSDTEPSGASLSILREPEQKMAQSVEYPPESDRFLVTDTDSSQERAVWMARKSDGLVVHGPPGTGKSQVIVNIIADALAHGQTVLVVCQKKAALDVVASRLRARGLSDLFLQVDDPDGDRKRVIEALKTQERPTVANLEDERRRLSDVIERLEAELRAYQGALFEVRLKCGLSYRRMLGRMARLRGLVGGISIASHLRTLTEGLTFEEVQRLGGLFEELEALSREAEPQRNPWSSVREGVAGDPHDREAAKSGLVEIRNYGLALDGCPSRNPTASVKLIGNCQRISAALKLLDHEVAKIRPGFRRRLLKGQAVRMADLSDEHSSRFRAALSDLLRWQNSALRVLSPRYLSARREVSRFLLQSKWLLTAGAADVLSALRSRVEATGLLVEGLERMSEWLTEGSIKEFVEEARRGQSVTGAMDELIAWLPRLPALIQYRATVRGLNSLESQILATLTDKATAPDHWAEQVELGALATWISQIEQDSPVLRSMSRELYDARKTELRRALEVKRPLESKSILARWGGKWNGIDLRWRSSLTIRGKGSKRVREIVDLWKDQGLLVLRPCWLANPGSVSQIFPLNSGLFDLVVFDEASQCPPEYAIPSLHRGARTVVAGDGKQLPPTMFFRSSFDFDTVEDEYEGEPADVESLERRHEVAVSTGADELLGLAQARLPEAYLNVHYRSKDPRLVAFSNAAFYQDRLEAPSPARPIRIDDHGALSLVRVNGQYTSSRTNPREVEAVVTCIQRLWERPLPRPTLGVVTFNEPQQQAILDRLDELSRRDTGFMAAYEQERARKEDGQDVGFFVKNLEAVQGDERDVMLFSTTYGHREDGRFSRAFLGPINQDGGERRLNVAITRAKEWCRIFTSLPIEQMADALSGGGVPRGSALGRSMLQLYLAYADAVTRGAKDVAESILERTLRFAGGSSTRGESVGQEESEFEVDVRDRIESRLGFQVDSQVGSGAFRIDLAIRHPEDPSWYLLGVECDGKAYHSAPAARAYDLWRQKILEERGWRIHRVWSTAWRQDPDRELERIREAVGVLMGPEARGGALRVEGDMSTSSTETAERVADMASAAGTETSRSVEPQTPTVDGGAKEAPDRAGVWPEGLRGARASKDGESPFRRTRKAREDAAARKSRNDIYDAIRHYASEPDRVCQQCHAPRGILIGRHGPFFKCTSKECGGTSSVSLEVLREAVRELGVVCPDCGSPAMAGRGRFGTFVGCSSYPKCRHSIAWRELKRAPRHPGT